MAPATVVKTADQLWKNSPAERCELVRGELVMMSPASSEHGWVVMNVAAPLHRFVKKHELGYVFGAESGFIIHRNPDSVRAPDVAFVQRARVTGTLPPGYFPGPPDLAVEVLSPNDSASAVQEKTEQWLEAGCQEVWLIDPRRRSATQCTWQSGAVVWRPAQQLATALLPGFQLPVESLFQ